MALEVLRDGEHGSSCPFTVLILSNPALAHGAGGHQVRRDPIAGDEPLFNACARMIVEALEPSNGEQDERMLSTPGVAGRTRFIALRDPALPVDEWSAFVREDEKSHWLVARSAALVGFLAARALRADVVFVVTASDRTRRSTAYSANDDLLGDGVDFEVDGRNQRHCFFSRIPGLIAFSAYDAPWEALHEFGHAMGSEENGEIVDLYTVSNETERHGINAKMASRWIPVFGTLDHTAYPSDRSNQNDPDIRRLFCEGNDPSLPALMDNVGYSREPWRCQHDRITRDFLLARIRAKMSRSEPGA